MARPRQGPGDSDSRREPGDVDSPATENDAAEDGGQTRAQGSRGSRRSTPAGETPTSPADPFHIESAGGFESSGDGRPRIDDADLDELDLEPPHLFDWTPERAGAVIRAGGYVLHSADSASHLPGGEDLWRATEADARAAGEPLARILNRYDSARRLAGMVDEAEFAAAMFDYARRNLRQRGAVVRHARAARRDAPATGPSAFDRMAAEQESRPYYVEPEPEPVPPPVDVYDEGEDPAQPEAFAFDPWAGR